MTTQHKGHLAVIALLAGVAMSCGASPKARFYSLAPAAEATATSAKAAYSVGVGPVTIPSAVDRPQIVVQVAPNRVEIDEFSRWVSPLDEAIGRVVAANLATLLGTPDVTSAQVASSRPTYRVAIDVQRFDSTLGKSVTMDTAWTVRRANVVEPRAGRTLASEKVADESYDALAAAHSRALARVSVEIASAIQALAARAK